jgi:hypothetical protein
LDLKFSSGLGRAGLGLGLVVCGLDYNTGVHATFDKVSRITIKSSFKHNFSVPLVTVDKRYPYWISRK